MTPTERDQLLALREHELTAPRPEDLVDALQDRIHPSSGRLRAATPVKVQRKPVTAPLDKPC